MKEGQPSLTAMFVAFARAVGTHEPELSRAMSDPTAEALVPRPFSTLVRAAKHSPRPDWAFRALRGASMGMIDHLAMRTAVIDRAVVQALAEGARQLVLLGAGFDARAYRMRELSEVVVFEVDHPSTQALKRKKARRLTRVAKELRYAGCDFEHVTLERALAEAGFDSNVPTVWIWEGVTMYLEPRAIEATLDTVARSSAPHSTLITSYATPALAAQGKLLGQLGVRLLAAIAEPMRGGSTPQQMNDRLTARGFEVISDVLPMDIASRFGVHDARHVLVVPDERLVVARKLA